MEKIMTIEKLVLINKLKYNIKKFMGGVFIEDRIGDPSLPDAMMIYEKSLLKKDIVMTRTVFLKEIQHLTSDSDLFYVCDGNTISIGWILFRIEELENILNLLSSGTYMIMANNKVIIAGLCENDDVWFKIIE
jgi:hypothetical protein